MIDPVQGLSWAAGHISDDAGMSSRREVRFVWELGQIDTKVVKMKMKTDI